MARTAAPASTATSRLEPRPGEWIKRDRPLPFSFDGKTYTGYEGDTISSALWAHGVRVIGRSFKYHRPRGDFAFDGSDPNALVQIGDEPNVRAGDTPIQDGLDVRPQNVTLSLKFDLLAVNGALHRFLPVGFYYKAFHSKRLWPLYERALRRAAGLGRVDPASPPRDYDKQYRHADVIVVGAGPAGLSAALAAARSGAHTLLLEQAPRLGGHLRYRGGALDDSPTFGREDRRSYLEVARGLIGQVEAEDRIELLSGTLATGYFEDHWVSAVGGRRLYKVRGRATVVAAGAFERVPVFDHNDRPGVLLGGAAARLLHGYAVLPGRRVVLASANDEGLRLALDLRAAGASVVVAEERAEGNEGLVGALREAGVTIRWRHAVCAARGKGRVRGAELIALGPGGQLPQSTASSQTHDCDTVVLSLGYTPNAGLLYQAHGQLRWDEARREMLPVELPRSVHAAGRVCGTHGLEAALLEGQIAGAQAARDAGCGPGPSDDERERLAALKHEAPPVTTRHVSIPAPGKFRFVDFAEDVTEADVKNAIAEGYDSIELLKRFTTISMGPDQGRYSSLTSVLLAARINGQSVERTGTTTSRPPARPVTLGAMAGRVMAPVRRTPLHRWHERYGCRFLNAGPWKRAEVYHDHSPADEVRTVRQAVGITDVSPLGKVWLYGSDVPELLSRLYTNKWRKLDPGKVRYGVMCSEEGIVLDDGVTARLDASTYYMTLTTGNSSAVPELIQWWLQSGWNLDVHWVNVTSQHAAINVAGPQSRALLERLCEGVDLSNEAFPYMGASRARLAGVEVLLLRIGFTGELSYEAHVPAGHAEHVWTQLLERGDHLGVRPFGLEAQRILRLEKGHLIVGQDTDALSSPLEAHLGWAVKLDKEDFLGKAALVRQGRRGVTQALVGIEMVDSQIVPPEGNLVVERGAVGELSAAGRVTSARFSPTLNRSIGLAWVPSERCEPGSEIAVRIEDRLHRARVVELPFYDPEGRVLRS